MGAESGAQAERKQLRLPKFQFSNYIYKKIQSD
jgi:hypothetical protein